jgi:hypothetical protein
MIILHIKIGKKKHFPIVKTPSKGNKKNNQVQYIMVNAPYDKFKLVFG